MDESAIACKIDGTAWLRRIFAPLIFACILFGSFFVMRFFGSSFVRAAFQAAIVVSLVVWGGALRAQEKASGSGGSSGIVQQDSVKIEPYTGPPIYLDEPQTVVVEPKVVATEVVPNVLGDGKVEREVARYSDNSFAANGFYKEYYPNGKVFIDGHFRKGRQDGEWKYYFDNGQVNRKMSFKDGKPNGSWEVFRADGTLAAKRGFKDGKRDGEWTKYDDTGKKPLSEEHYVAGTEDGVWKTWFPNGQQKQQVGFKNGKRDGTNIEWDDKGQKLGEAQWVDGKLHGTFTRWLPNGKTVVVQYDNGKVKSTTK
jgi:antitoxin component YwqK of YwqJK toxin-antitoxin module